jgi:hypothetical protein
LKIILLKNKNLNLTLKQRVIIVLTGCLDTFLVSLGILDNHFKSIK